MYHYKYGDFTSNQISETKERMRKQIFFLLLIGDPEKRNEFQDVDIVDAFKNVLYTFGGLNDLLNYPQQLVYIMSQLNEAFLEVQKKKYDFQKYRKLILDAGHEVLAIKEVG